MFSGLATALEKETYTKHGCIIAASDCFRRNHGCCCRAATLPGHMHAQNFMQDCMTHVFPDSLVVSDTGQSAPCTGWY